jgi:lipoyl(octanoyl) transferase
MEISHFIVEDLGTIEYETAWKLQAAYAAEIASGSRPPTLLLLEHPHVYTFGRTGHAENLLWGEEQLKQKGIDVHWVDRGGDVTYHGPGQLVVYPIIDLRSKLRKDVHRYVHNLELSAIRTLDDFNLKAARRPPYTGIWIGDRKIAAIGVAVRRCITFHGLALNVNTDLSYFKRIVPCGLAWADVTSMERELGAEQNPAAVRERFLVNFAEIFGYSDVKEGLHEQGCHSPSLGLPTIGTTGTF